MPREKLARFLAPAAFLAAATVVVLLVRAGLDREAPASPPPPAAVTTTAPAATTAPDPGETETGTTTEAGQFHEIQAGDTLGAIADRYGTSVEQLLVLNPGLDPVALQRGQRIRVK